MAAAAAVADAMLEHRQNGAAAAADPREGHELARRQAAEDELDAMIANGDFDGGAGEQLSMMCDEAWRDEAVASRGVVW